MAVDLVDSSCFLSLTAEQKLQQIYEALGGSAGSSGASHLGSENLDTGQATIETTAPAADIPASTTRRGVVVMNTGSETVYVGGVGVTTADGFPLASGSSMQIDTLVALYFVTASATSTIAWLET